MADKKISQLTGATTPLAGTEVLPIVQGGSTVKVSVANLTAGRTVETSRLGVNKTPGTGEGVLSAQYNSTTLYSTAGSWPGSADAIFSGAYVINASATTGAFAGNTYVVRNGSSVYQAAGMSAVSVAGSGRSPTLNFWAQDGASTFATRASIDSSGNMSIANGNLVVGTAAKGIDFSANTHAAGMTSELLNWYEEGTWTPTYEGSTGSAGAVAYSEQAGSYTRIGNRVILTGTIILTNNGDWTGDVRIGGIPFNGSIASGSEAMGSVQMRNVTTAGAYVVADLGRTSTSKIAFINVNSAGAATAVACADVPDNGAFLFTIVYRVA